MKNTLINYNMEEFLSLTTPCPHNESVCGVVLMVGSPYCQKCKHFNMRDTVQQIVRCKK